MLLQKGLEFWEKYIKTNTAPEDVAPQYEGENAAVANEKCISLIKQVKETDEQIKALKEDSDKLKEEIRAYFGDAEKLTYFGDTVATYKTAKKNFWQDDVVCRSPWINRGARKVHKGERDTHAFNQTEIISITIIRSETG